jgi:hypothetical protein
MKARPVASRPWDFTLYRCDDGALVLKVIFSEGTYKTDVGRFFEIDPSDVDAADIDALADVATQIRAAYPDVAHPSVAASALSIA